MSFGTKYRCTFYDKAKLNYQIDFQWDGYDEDDGINVMIATGNPLTVDFLSDSDDLFENPVRGTKASLRVRATTSFQYVNFFTITDLQVKALIYAAGDLIFSGYVLPKSYEEPYNDTPYEVTISMIDGLAALKTIKYDDSGVAYTGRKLESQILLDILLKINVIQFTEIINIYETRMDNDEDDSPIDQDSIDSEVFAGMYCYDVLQHLLSKWNSLIRQRNGEFYIYRPLEMIATFYARTFTASTKSDSSDNYVQAINRTATPSELGDINGGTLMLIPPAKKITITQDFGYKDSWIKNWQLKSSTYDSVSDKWQNWTPGPGFARISIPGESDGMVLQSQNSTPPAGYIYNYQSFAIYALATSDVIMFSFDYLHYNLTGGTISGVGIYVQIKSNDGTNWLYKINDAESGWQGSEAFITWTENIPEGKSDLITFSTKIPGLPVNGPYTITIWGTKSASSFFTLFKNIKFYSTSDTLANRKFTTTGLFGLLMNKIDWQRIATGHGRFFSNAMEMLREYKDFSEVVQKEYIITNALEGDELTFEYILGDVLMADVQIDNIIEQFAGALAIIGSMLSSAAAGFVSSWSYVYAAIGITISSTGNVIRFSGWYASIATIVNVSGDLSGTVANIQAGSVGTERIDRVYLTGSSGTADIDCDGLTKQAYFNEDLETSCITFVTQHQASYALHSITVTYDYDTDWYIQFESNGENFTGTTAIHNTSGNLNGTIDLYQAFVAGTDRIDDITLTGTTGGSATITCKSKSELVISSANNLIPTAAWNTRGGTENDPLLEIAGGEIGYQFSRSRQRLAGLPINDLHGANNLPHLNILGSFTDDLNRVGSLPRKFGFNNGSWDVKNRHWNVDLIEIVDDVNAKIYGAWYNWYVVDTGSLAPIGWSVPTQDNFQTLRTYLGGESTAGGHLKESGLLHWITPNTGADNSSLFNAIGAGIRMSGFIDIKATTYFWASDGGGGGDGLIFWLAHAYESFSQSSCAKYFGCSIRCIKNTTTLSDGQTGTMTDIDGNIYPTICIGTQEYMAANLKVEHYNDETPIPLVTNDSAWAALTTGAMCYYPIT